MSSIPTKMGKADVSFPKRVSGRMSAMNQPRGMVTSCGTFPQELNPWDRMNNPVSLSARSHSTFRSMPTATKKALRGTGCAFIVYRAFRLPPSLTLPFRRGHCATSGTAIIRHLVLEGQTKVLNETDDVRDPKNLLSLGSNRYTVCVSDWRIQKCL